jgi:hypothetical protein
MTFEIRIAQDADANEWDAIISASPHGTIFHQWDWLKITEKHTRTTLYPLIGIKDSKTVGICPLFFQKNGPIRMVFSPPPHAALFYLGPVMVGYDSLKQEKRETNYIDFQKSIDAFIKNDLKGHYISISLPYGFYDPRPFVWSGYTVELNFDYVIDLTCDIGYLFQTLDKKQRQNLSRAKKRGITVEIGGKKDYEKILDLMDIRYNQQGKNVMESREYFLEIYDKYKENLKIFVAKVDGEVVTGTIDLQYRDTHYSWIGNPKPKKQIAPSPNDILIYESIRIAQEQGFKYYVTMSAAGDKRLHSYYASKFNPTIKVYFSVKKNTFLAGIFEKIYTHIVKPLDGWIKNSRYVK